MAPLDKTQKRKLMNRISLKMEKPDRPIPFVKQDFIDAIAKTELELTGIINSTRAKFPAKTKRDLTDNDIKIFLIQVLQESME